MAFVLWRARGGNSFCDAAHPAPIRFMTLAFEAITITLSPETLKSRQVQTPDGSIKAQIALFCKIYDIIFV